MNSTVLARQLSLDLSKFKVREQIWRNPCSPGTLPMWCKSEIHRLGSAQQYANTNVPWKSTMSFQPGNIFCFSASSQLTFLGTGCQSFRLTEGDDGNEELDWPPWLLTPTWTPPSLIEGQDASQVVMTHLGSRQSPAKSLYLDCTLAFCVVDHGAPIVHHSNSLDSKPNRKNQIPSFGIQLAWVRDSILTQDLTQNGAVSHRLKLCRRESELPALPSPHWFEAVNKDEEKLLTSYHPDKQHCILCVENDTQHTRFSPETTLRTTLPQASLEHSVISFYPPLRGADIATWSSISCLEPAADEKLWTTITVPINTLSTPSHLHLGGP